MATYIEVNEVREGEDELFPILINTDYIGCIREQHINIGAHNEVNSCIRIAGHGFDSVIFSTSTYEDLIQVLSSNNCMKVLKCKFKPIKAEKIYDVGCDRNLCTQNEYNNIGCEDCIVNKKEEE